MEKLFKADLDAPGLRESLYKQMNNSLVNQVNDILNKFGLTSGTYQTTIEAQTQEGKISVNIPEIPDELREKVQKELNGLGLRENYKIMLA